MTDLPSFHRSILRASAPTNELRTRSLSPSHIAEGRVPSPGACIEDREFTAAKHPFRRGSVLRVNLSPFSNAWSRLREAHACPRPGGPKDDSPRRQPWDPARIEHPAPAGRKKLTSPTPPTDEKPARQPLAQRVGIGIGIGIENSKQKNRIRSRSRLRSRYRGGKSHPQHPAPTRPQ